MTKTNNKSDTKHTCCEPGRGPGFVRTPGCPRCDELKAGAPTRTHAGVKHFGQNARNEAARVEAIRNHDFAACAAKHGGVCTCFEW